MDRGFQEQFLEIKRRNKQALAKSVLSDTSSLTDFGMIFGAMAVGGDHEFHIALEDWTLPGGATACPGNGRFGVGSRRPRGSSGTSSSSSGAG